LECKLNLYEAEHKKHEMRAQTMADEHCNFAATNQKELARVSTENNILRRELRECEVKFSEAEVEQVALSGDCQILEESLFNLRNKLKNSGVVDQEVTSNSSSSSNETSIVISSHSNNNNNKVNNGAAPPNPNPNPPSKVSSLVQQVIYQLAQLFSRNPDLLHNNKSQEDQMFAFVSDVLIKTDAECISANNRVRQFGHQLHNIQLERDNFALENYDFKTSQKTLLRRLDLAETALSDESALKWTHTENTISMLERRVATMQIELLSMAEKDLYICAEHRTNGEQVSALHTHHHALLIKPT